MRLSSTRGGSGDPMVLIHGTGSCKEVWEPVLPALQRRHDVLALDLPGFGESPPLDRPHTVAALADAVEETMDDVAWHGAHLVGNSLGGWLALELARRGRARGVVAISPSGLWTPGEAAYARSMVLAHYAAAKVAAPLGSTPGGWVGGLVMLARPWRVPPEAMALQRRRLAGATAVREAIDDQAANQPSGLPEIDVPVLILWGTQDRLLFPRQAKRFVALIPDAELRMLPGLGHMPMSDDPEVVSQAILSRTAG